MRSRCCWGYVYADDNGMGGCSYRCGQCGGVYPETISDLEIYNLKRQFPKQYGDHPYIPLIDGDR